MTPAGQDASKLPHLFAAAMDRLAPFEPDPSLAVAVSGGADSMALAILSLDWVRRRGGTILALVVDHGLRPESAAEAELTINRLSAGGIPAQCLTLRNLAHGPALAERARIARYAALASACAAANILHLLLGHHAADQTETLMMRVLRGSQTRGLAGMAALRETAGLRLLRPLLTIEPADLRHFLTVQGVSWVEDPSNRDQRALRSRLRRHPSPIPEIAQALATAGRLRQREEAEAAEELAQRATIRPEGFALLSPGRIGVLALQSLIQGIGGSPYAPSAVQVAGLAAEPRPATVAGVRFLTAGRFGEGLLVVREAAAIGPPVPAAHGAFWDGRFRLIAHDGVPDGAFITALGDDAARFKRPSGLPSAVLHSLPAIRVGELLAFIPHLGYRRSEDDVSMNMLFSPPQSAFGSIFQPPA